jgi:HAD superfamily hydrolase (TIGR01509 family)
MSIKCITFDLDDTLWACAPVIRRAEQLFYEWLGWCYPQVTQLYSLEALVAHRRTYFEKYPELHYDITQLRKQWLTCLAQESDCDVGLVEGGFSVFWRARNDVELVAEVRNVLRDLSQSYCVGVITNGNADVYHIGIGDYFDFVITAAEAGVGKPHPNIFRAALAEARVLAEEAVHVGDDPHRDILGAQGIGMRTIWMNPNGCLWEGRPSPDAAIQKLSELQRVLELWN